ncbi:unnamed protein product [Ectocarpus fasciculatus]
MAQAQQPASSVMELEYDPAGLALKYGVEGDVLDSELDDKSSDSNSSGDIAPDVNGCSRPEDPAPSGIAGDTVARLSGGTAAALQKLQNQNAMLLEAVEEKSRQVLELGALVEALEPVPGLDPNAFLSVLHCGGDTDRGKDLDYRDVKIIQLAKRIRDRDAKLDKERTSCLKARREADVLAKELVACRRQLELVSSSGPRLDTQPADVLSSARIDGTEERLRQQVVLLRNKLHEAQEEVKKTYRALSKEVGGTSLGLGRTLNDTGGWKGRAQQIVMLKATVKQLQTQLRNGRDPGQSGEPRSKQGRKDVDSQAQEEIHYMERHRGHVVEQLEAKCNARQEEAEALRGQLVAKGARVASLEKTNAQIRNRARMLLAKSDTDDRLVDALRKEVQALRNVGS